MADARILYLVPGPLSRARGLEELERRRSHLQEWAFSGTEMYSSQPDSIEPGPLGFSAMPTATPGAAHDCRRSRRRSSSAWPRARLSGPGTR